MSKSPFIVAGAIAALVAAAAFGAGALRPSRLSRALPEGRGSALARPKSLCPRGTLPADGVCIPVPRPSAAPVEARESIPRRPDRDPDYARYRLPAEGRPRAAEPSDGVPPGSTALAVDASLGVEVRALALEGQQGPAVVVYQGPLIGGTLVLHVIAAAARHEYLVLVGNLASPASLERGAQVPPGTVLGRTGAQPLIWAPRLLRPGVDAKTLAPNDVLSDQTAVWVDPRNLLPTK